MRASFCLGGKAIEKAFKEREIYQLRPLEYKWNFAKQKEKGMVLKEVGRWARLEARPGVQPVD